MMDEAFGAVGWLVVFGFGILAGFVIIRAIQISVGFY